MQSPARDLVGRTQRRRFGDAFSGGAGLTDSGRSFLLKKLGDEDDAGGGGDLLSLAELGDMSDPKRRQEVRAWFESAFALGWDRAVLRPRELGDLAPAARLVPDGRLSPRSLSQRARAALERAGHSRWSELLDLSVASLLGTPGLGPTTVVSVLAACFDRSLIGLAMSVEIQDGGDLAALLTEERRGPKQPVLESLLDAATADSEASSADSRRSAAARRLLTCNAPWALENVSALSELLSGITDDQDRLIFTSTELRSERRSLGELAEELGISRSRAAQRRDRAAVQVREELTAAPAPLEWLVKRVRQTLGRVTTPKTAHEVLRRFGLDPSTGHEARRVAELLLWLAGPFDPVPRCPGWLCVEPDDLLSRTREMLTQDGGVRSLATTKASLEELGVTPAQVGAWLGVCGAAVVDDDLAVWLSGPLADVLERLMDASGRGLTASECRHLLLSGGRSAERSELERALRVRRFRRVTGEVYELTSWSQSSAGVPPSKPPSTRPQRPGSGATDSAVALDQDRGTDVPPDGESSSGALFGGPEVTCDRDPNEQLGLPGIARLEPGGSRDGGVQMSGLMAGWTLAEPDRDGSVSHRAWLLATIDDDLMRGGESAVPDDLVRCLGVGWRQRRTFSSRYGPVTLANDGAEPSRGPLRPIAMAAGARPGDVLALGFASEGDVVVEVRTGELVARALAPGSDLYAGGQSMGGSQVDETTDETRGAT